MGVNKYFKAFNCYGGNMIKHDSDDCKGLSKKYDRLKLHLFYLFVFFTLITAFLVSDKWTGQKNFTEYLTNIATFVSLVLAVVAIFYSFISNASFSQSLASVSTISDEIFKTKDAMQSMIDHAVELEKSAEQNAVDLKNISSSVENQVCSLKDALNSLDLKTESLQVAVDTIPPRIDSIAIKLAEGGGGAGERKISGADKDVSEILENFLGCSSVAGMFVLLAGALSFKVGKRMDIDKLSKIIDISNDYLLGYFVACNSMGFVDADDVDNSAYYVRKVVMVNDYLAANIEEKLKSGIDTDFNDSKKNRDNFMAKIKIIDKCFID